jgi:hypothetical protein
MKFPTEGKAKLQELLKKLGDKGPRDDRVP